jgi:hypothetical protein
MNRVDQPFLGSLVFLLENGDRAISLNWRNSEPISHYKSTAMCAQTRVPMSSVGRPGSVRSAHRELCRLGISLEKAPTLKAVTLIGDVDAASRR